MRAHSHTYTHHAYPPPPGWKYREAQTDNGTVPRGGLITEQVTKSTHKNRTIFSSVWLYNT